MCQSVSMANVHQQHEQRIRAKEVAKQTGIVCSRKLHIFLSNLDSTVERRMSCDKSSMQLVAIPFSELLHLKYWP
jgi:hypothetical protein